MSDDIQFTDEDTGIKYIFRGLDTYMIVDGKEVLVKNEGRKKTESKDISNRSGE